MARGRLQRLVAVLASGGLLGYGRSKVRPDGVLFLEGTAVVDAPMERAFSRIVSADGLKAWWIGSLDQVEASPTWPEPGGTLKFKLGSQPVIYTTGLERAQDLGARGDHRAIGSARGEEGRGVRGTRVGCAAFHARRSAKREATATVKANGRPSGPKRATGS